MCIYDVAINEDKSQAKILKLGKIPIHNIGKNEISVIITFRHTVYCYVISYE